MKVTVYAQCGAQEDPFSAAIKACKNLPKDSGYDVEVRHGDEKLYVWVKWNRWDKTFNCGVCRT